MAEKTNVRVAKFGGSSLADAEQFRKVINIIKADASRRYVVPSAPGKRFPGDTKVTDMLFGCYDKALKGQNIEDDFAAIRERYDSIIRDLGVDMSLDEEYTHIRYAFVTKAGKDYAASRGEYLCGKILAKCLGYEFIDAAQVVFFKDDGTFDSERTNRTMARTLKEIPCAVIPGFYGSMPNDTIKTFSRGGSDISGAIVARAVNAMLYENWTDVSGFMMADPRIVKKPRAISVITYRELRELSYMGATVLHEDSIFPVSRRGIPINIRNTNHPEDAGTMIVDKIVESEPQSVVTGIAGRKGFCVITLEKERMNVETGFVCRVLNIFAENGISIEHVPTGIDSLSVIVNESAVKDKERMIFDTINAEIAPDLLTVEHGISLIAVVGRAMRCATGTAARVFSSVAAANVNIRMIDQGSSELNIILGVSDNDFEMAIKAIYNAFV